MGVFKSDKTTKNNQDYWKNKLEVLGCTFCFELTDKVLTLLITQYLQE